MSTEVFAPEITFETKVNNHSSIQYRNVAPQATNTVTLSSAAITGPSEFIISPAVCNLAKSRLNLTLQIPAVAGAYIFLNANFWSVIGRMVVYDSATNAVLLDCSNFEKFAALTIPAGTHIDDFLTKSVGTGEYIQSTTDGTQAYYPYEDIFKNGAIAQNIDGSGSDLKAINPMSSRQNFVGQTALNTAMFVTLSLPFSSLKSTVLGLDKMIYSPTNLVVSIYWNSGQNFAFTSTSSTAIVNAGGTLLAVNPIVSKLSLSLACESNLTLISQIITDTMNGGFEFMLPYPTTIRTNISSAANHSYTLQLTRAYGNKILAILTAPFQSGASLANEHPIGDSNQQLIYRLYNTFLNNVSIKSPSGFNVETGEPWTYGNSMYLKGSVIQTSAEYYLCEFVHIDSWFGEKPFYSIDYTQVDGLDVGAASSTWMWNSVARTGTTPTTNWISVIIGQKTLKLTSMGAQVM